MTANQRGFSLLELVIALALSSVILLGILSIATQTLRFQYEGMRKGEASGLTLYSIDQMERELENASHLELGYPLSGGSDEIRGCTNWTKSDNLPAGLPIDGNQKVAWFDYCVDGQDTLYRDGGAGCPASPWTVACGTSGSPVAFRSFHRMGNFAHYFYRDDGIPGLRAHFIVGNSTPTPNVPIPVAYPMDLAISMNKPLYAPACANNNPCD